MYKDYVDPATRIYSGHENGGFVVCAGYLAFTVLVFTCCAVSAIGAILARRWALKPSAELGGPRKLAYITCGSFIGLWVLYLIFSIIRDAEAVEAWNSIPGLSPKGTCP